MNETTLNGQSADIVSENIQRLKQIFPEVFCEDSIDFEKLQAVLGEYTDDNEERYNFTWWGKGRALKLAQTPSMGTLRPCKEESKDWDTTENLYIEGDNLEVLKLLQKSYHSRVKMIYIDPPYNTGNDFIYPDDYREPIRNYFELTGQVDEEGKKIGTNSEASGRYHTNWLNMMYPRLRLARNLLSDDGLVFISIDDYEVENLIKLCKEIFGEGNFINTIVRLRSTSGKTVSKQFPINIEYLIICAKSPLFALNPIYKPLASSTIKMYSRDDNDGRGKYRLYPLQKTSSPGPETTYDYIDNHGKVWKCPEKGWRMIQSKLKKLENEGRLCLENSTLSEKAYWNERESTGKLADTLWDDLSENNVGTNEVASLFNGKFIFDNPKPVDLLNRCIQICGNNFIALDFFSGSGTLGHAIIYANSTDGGDRKFIMVQLPEPTDENSEAFKAGYKNICEIGKEHIRRAGEKIKAELREKQKEQLSILEEDTPVNPDDLDIGFKVLKLDTSNLKKWNPDYENIEESLLDSIENYVDGRSELDVVYEIMLKYGIDLTLPLEEYEVGGKKIYSIGYGALMICLDREITTDVANEIVRLKENLKPEVMRVVFKDNGFKDDSAKTNTKEILRNAGIEEIVSV